jgi:hypothetical protein
MKVMRSLPAPPQAWLEISGQNGWQEVFRKQASLRLINSRHGIF